MDTTSSACPAFLLSSSHHIWFSTSLSDQTGSQNTHTNTLACTHWHSPQGHGESKVMSLIYGKGREADIYRQVLVLHMHTVQRAAWNPLISLYTRCWHNSTFILQHLLSHGDRAQIDSRVLRRQASDIVILCFFFVSFLNLRRMKQN